MSRATLTFDNGPSADTTPFVLDQLQQRGLKAYFCLVGSQLQAANEHVDLAREAYSRGHVLVNHSLTHGTALGDNPTEKHAQQEIGAMHDLMSETLGDWDERWFRPFGRGGQIGPHLFSLPGLEQLRVLKYSVLLWNCVPRDWEDVEGWVETALFEIEKTEHTVIVLHDIGTGAMQQLPRFLNELGRRAVEITLQLPDCCVPFREGKNAVRKEELDRLVFS